MRRALTPLRIHTSSCASSLSNLAASDFLDFQLLRLARLIGGEIARIRQQTPAIEFDDARGDVVEETRDRG